MMKCARVQCELKIHRFGIIQ